jgi:PAS domain S-box-containing protein
MKQILKIDDGIDALFRFATEGIIIISPIGAIVRMNPFAEKMFGYQEEELIGQKIEILVPERFSDAHAKDREKYNLKPKVRHLESGLNLYGLRKNGNEFPAEIALSPFTNSNGTFIVAFVIDITIRRQAEDALLLHTETLEKEVASRTSVLEKTIEELEITKAELKRNLQKEQEMNDFKSNFISRASHEFRTPLTTMQSSIALISRYCMSGDQKNQMKHLGKVKDNINLLTDMLDEFLALKKIEEPISENEIEAGNLKLFLHQLVDELRSILSQEQTIHIEYTGKEIVSVNYTILKNILSALVSNAIKYSLADGMIVIESTVSDATIEISVKDTGIGILQKDKEHIFDQFFRGDNAIHIQGTGLGLCIVLKSIQQMNATINFESELNKGSIFRIVIPQI